MNTLDTEMQKLFPAIRESMHGEVTTAILSAIAVVEFNQGKLSKEEKISIIKSVETNFKDLVLEQLELTYPKVSH